MEKISGILPGSARLSAVDLKESPVRPGTPSFGRPEGVSSLREAMLARPAITSSATRAANLQIDQLDWRAKDQRSATIAADIAEKFFIKKERMNQMQPGEPERMMNSPAIFIVAPEAVSSKPAGFKTNSVGSLSAASGNAPVDSTLFEENDSAMEIEMPELAQPEGLFPKGSFIDREV